MIVISRHRKRHSSRRKHKSHKSHTTQSSNYLDSKGYLRDRYGDLIHRKIAYKKYVKGNYAKPYSAYVIHHINGKKTDNRLKNLQIITQEEHEVLHGITKKSYIATKSNSDTGEMIDKFAEFDLQKNNPYIGSGYSNPTGEIFPAKKSWTKGSKEVAKVDNKEPEGWLPGIPFRYLVPLALFPFWVPLFNSYDIARWIIIAYFSVAILNDIVNIHNSFS